MRRTIRDYFSAGILGLMLVGCGSDIRYLHDGAAYLPDGRVIELGFECSVLERSGGSSKSGGFDVGIDGKHIGVETKINRDSVDVEITFKEEVIHDLNFSESFLESAEIETVTIVGADGVQYLLRFWGDDQCAFLEFPDAGL